MEPEHQLLPPQAFPNDPAAFYPDPSSDITGGLPISLDSLRDGPPGSKPFYPYSTLIRCAPSPSANSHSSQPQIRHQRFSHRQAAARGHLLRDRVQGAHIPSLCQNVD